jgi:hypothetical protein
MNAEPQKEHQWLQKFIGEWMFEGAAQMEPGKPPEAFRWTEKVRPLGGLWILAECEAEMPGCGPSATVLTLGYDPLKGRFVGAFVGSMMAQLWVYEGTLDSAGRVLTLETEGPDMATEGKTTQYKDVYEFKSDDHRVVTSHMLGGDGQWHTFMTAEYHRKKRKKK